MRNVFFSKINVNLPYLKMNSFCCLFLLFSYLGMSSCKLQQVSEGYQIAIESSGRLLPTVEYIERLSNDLNAIRSKFPETLKVHHIPKWEPGVLFLTDVKSDSIENINRSEYGPIESQSILGNDLYKVMFQKPYNPEILANLLKVELGILNAEPNWVTGRSTYITVNEIGGNDKNKTNLYVFRKSRKPCNFACDNIRTTIFKVSGDYPLINVELVNDSGSEDGNN